MTSFDRYLAAKYLRMIRREIRAGRIPKPDKKGWFRKLEWVKPERLWVDPSRQREN